MSGRRSRWFRRWREQRAGECIQLALERSGEITCEEVLAQLPALVAEEADGKRTDVTFADANVHLLTCPTCLVRSMELAEQQRSGQTITPPWRIRYGRNRRS